MSTIVRTVHVLDLDWTSLDWTGLDWKNVKPSLIGQFLLFGSLDLCRLQSIQGQVT